ncbi:MAG: thioredoxin domain-containing protein, partial [Magnetococcales bacterium]|nr:thioredoxin domain-containing protein [Magnetococcales bacterium]
MNLLGDATSPYLRQHAHHPVHWRPWNDASLQLARSSNRPIFLSIGYSSCHWCHVMAHESFEDPMIAALLNRDFVAIKVDREERPDLDTIYQQAHYLITRQPGGWPLSMFLTPTLEPFFSGTYFPPTPRHGLPSFTQVLVGVSRFYQQQPQQAASQGQDLMTFLRQHQKTTRVKGGVTDPGVYVERLLESFDETHGGFGGAPKFPHTTDQRLLLRLAFRDGETEYAEAVALTLDAMCRGGIHDQIGGGFARYSTDEFWHVPHFEKMLYDNALMLRLLVEADTLLGGDAQRSRARRGIVAWTLETMRLEDGGFAGSLDADSEGIEGWYYLWNPEELRGLFTADECELACAFWGIEAEGVVEGKSLPRIQLKEDQVRERFGPQAVETLERLRLKLLEARQRRKPPGRDDKLLTGWNALMLTALLGHAALERDAELMATVVEQIHQLRRLMRRDKQWLAVSGRGQAHTHAFLDDYAALIELYLEAALRAPDPSWLSFAEEAAHEMLERFEDRQNGGFFLSCNAHDSPLRAKVHFDASTPSGNGLAATVLLRLTAATGKPLYRQAAQRALETFHPFLAQSQGGHGQLLLANDIANRG